VSSLSLEPGDLNISVIHLSLPSDFREKLWEGLGYRGRDWVRTTFWDRNVSLTGSRAGARVRVDWGRVGET